MAFAPSPPYFAVVAIDFGTTYSGFALSFLSNEGDAGIFLNKEWGNEQGFQTPKAPTSVLLTPNKVFDTFGYEAAEKYAQMEEADDQKYLYFERFKMLLHNTEDINIQTRIVAKNGKDMLALDVFAMVLRHLKGKALEIIGDNTTIEYGPSDIKWVITVPAIWRASAKVFMREAAYEARLASCDAPDQIVIALEPEAASLYCRSLTMKEFFWEKGTPHSNDDCHTYEGTQYLVVDVGGGTLDVTAHEIISETKVKEIHRASGGAFGGIKVDAEFEKLLIDIFGSAFVQKFKSDHPADWLDMMSQFEVKKRSERVSEVTTRIRLPCNFINFYRSHGEGRSCRSAYKEEEVKIYRSEFLCIGPTIMQKLYEPAISGIINHLKLLLKKPQMRQITLMFLVGGLAESPILRSRIRAEFGKRYKVLIPNKAKTAVLRGAVMFGKSPDFLEERVLTETYGTLCYQDFQWGRDDRSKLEIIEGKAMCKDYFRVLATTNEVIKVGECRQANFTPSQSDQTAVGFRFYTTRQPTVRYVTDEGVQLIPRPPLVVKSPDKSKGTDRTIELKLYFGGTEIVITAVDVESQNTGTDSIQLHYLPAAGH